MAILLDSALVDEAKKAFSLGFVSGITTNPKLLSQVAGEPEDILRELCSLSPGPVFYQLTGLTADQKLEEALRFQSLSPRKLVLKIPSTTENLALLARLSSGHGMACAATAVYGPGQAFLACEAGAKYLIPYVNRITAMGGDGPGFVAEIAAIAREAGKGTEILAASLKTPREVAQAVLAGARHVTLPMALIEALGNDRSSDEAIAMFQSFVRRPG